MRVAPLELAELPPHLSDVYDYWRTLKGDRLAPTWSEFELIEVPAPVLPTTMVVDVADPLEDSRFRFWGSRMTDVHGADMTGKCPYDLTPPELGQQLYDDHARVILDVEPFAHHYSFETTAGYTHSHSVIRMPIINDKGKVSQIVVVVDYSPEALEMIARDRGKLIRIVSAPHPDG